MASSRTERAAAGARLWQRIAADVDELAVVVAAAVLDEVPAIAIVPESERVAAARAFIAMVAEGCGGGRAPSPEAIELAVAFGRTRAEQGIPLEPIVRSTRVVTRMLHERVVAEAAAVELSASEVLEMTSSWMQWLDQLSESINRGVGEAELERGRGQAYKAAEFLYVLLNGDLARSEVHTQALALGLDPEIPFHTIRARAATAIEPHQLRALIADRIGAGALVGFAGDDVAGLAPVVPDLPDTLRAGIGPALPLDRARESYELATQALEAACAFERTGAFRVDDLALEVAIADERIGGALEERCLSRLDDMGERGTALEATLRAFLSGGMRFEATAQALHLHPNTLRHRLSRYQELTGLDLHRVDDIVALWIGLERRRIGRGAQQP